MKKNEKAGRNKAERAEMQMMRSRSQCITFMSI